MSKRTTLCLIVVALLASPSLADWLVTRDGERIETQGPWRVEGRRVLFELPNGTLSAARLSEIDLEASEAATRDARSPAEEPAAQSPVRETGPALVLDESNVGTVRAPVDDLSEVPEARVESAESSGEVNVVTWRQSSSPGQELRLSGQITNGSPSLAVGLRLIVTVYDEEGAVSGRQPADLPQSSLAGGRSMTFEVGFPGLYVQRGAGFQLDYDLVQVGTPPAEEEGEGEETEGEGSGEGGSGRS